MWFVLIGALVVGLTLGLMGSGGSIMTVPVLTYLLGHESKVAIAESLAIVGGIAIVAAIPYAKAHLVSWRSVIWFGLPGMVGTYMGAWLSGFLSGGLLLVIFAAVMLTAAVMMLRGSQAEAAHDDPSAAEQNPSPAKDQTSTATADVPEGTDEQSLGEQSLGEQSPSEHPIWKIVLEGLVVGIITGLVGVGGGFLIVPALVILGGLSMRLAVGTSLVVIALKSFTGFAKHLDLLHEMDAGVDWRAVSLFIVVGILASFGGKMLSGRISQQRLRQGFAIFLVVMGSVVLVKEGIGLWQSQASVTARPPHPAGQAVTSTAF